MPPAVPNQGTRSAARRPMRRHPLRSRPSFGPARLGSLVRTLAILDSGNGTVVPASNHVGSRREAQVEVWIQRSLELKDGASAVARIAGDGDARRRDPADTMTIAIAAERHEECSVEKDALHSGFANGRIRMATTARVVC